MKQDEGLTQIVTSGLGTWAFPVRTAGRCEYVVINIGE
jgi:predicted MPP superfamily phosphohydrolase